MSQYNAANKVGAPARKWRALGRIEHTLLDREFSVRPNRPKTIARNPTIPQKVTNVSIHDKGPEPSRLESSDPMKEAGETSTRITQDPLG